MRRRLCSTFLEVRRRVVGEEALEAVGRPEWRLSEARTGPEGRQSHPSLPTFSLPTGNRSLIPPLTSSSSTGGWRWAARLFLMDPSGPGESRWMLSAPRPGCVLTFALPVPIHIFRWTAQLAGPTSHHDRRSSRGLACEGRALFTCVSELEEIQRSCRFMWCPGCCLDCVNA